MDAAGELAQLLERLAQLRARARERVARRGGSRSSCALASRSCSASDTSRCCAPSCRLRSSRRRSASPACTMRARDAASFSCASALASAWATSSATSHRRRSAPSGRSLGVVRRRDDDAPQPARDAHRRGHGRAEAERAQALRERRRRRPRSRRRAAAARLAAPATLTVSPSSGRRAPTGRPPAPRRVQLPTTVALASLLVADDARVRRAEQPPDLLRHLREQRGGRRVGGHEVAMRRSAVCSATTGAEALLVGAQRRAGARRARR